MIEKNNLLIIGAGQYGRIVKELAESLDTFHKIDFVDNYWPLAIGTMADLEKLRKVYGCAVIAIGDPNVRMEMFYLAKAAGYQLVTLIHPKAYVSPSAVIGEGCIIEPNATVQSKAVVGDACLISAGAVINHNAVVESGCHIDCNATICARAVVHANTKITSGEVKE